jgi:AcrR family transcriptional regulator
MDSNVKDRIVKGALQLFLANGVKTMTMDDIAAQLAISKRTIYEHFKDKDELLSEAIIYNKCTMDKQFEEILASSVSAIELMVFFVLHNRKSIVNSRSNFINEVKKYHPEVFEKTINNFQYSQKQRFRDIFHSGVEQGVFRTDLNFEIVFSFMNAGIVSILNTEQKIKDKYSIGEILEELLPLCVKMITTDYGFKIFEENIEKRKIIEKYNDL